MSNMTLRECIKAFEEILSKPVHYNGNIIEIDFVSHNEAMQKMMKARKAIDWMKFVDCGEF